LTTLQKQAEALGLGANFKRVEQTTRFRDGPNSVGVEMKASSLSGMDSTGVNDGSKNSTLVTYMSDAWNWGADIFCECEVRYVKKHPREEGWIVFFAWHGGVRGSFKNNIHEDLMWVHAKNFVFMGAGSIATTEILLRSKRLGLSMSRSVGTEMSGNGDILAFGYDTDAYVNGMGRSIPSAQRPIGPTITGVIDCREQASTLDGFVIEEGAITAALAPVFQAMLDLMPGKKWPTKRGWIDHIKHGVSRQASRMLGPYFPYGSIEKTQTYLIMSHDSNQAILTLKNDKPQLKFRGVGRSEHVKKLNGLLAEATNAVGGIHVDSPFFAALGEQEITVHPIGGAIMSRDGTSSTGATNHLGQLLTGSGDEVHEGLVIVDGAVIPTALGANPFATITALAERSVEGVAQKKGIKIDYDTINGALDLFGEPAFPMAEEETAEAESLIKESIATKSGGIAFTEVMSGFIHVGEDIKDFELAAKTARGLSESAKFFLSVKSWNINDLVYDKDHKAMLTGSFSCAALPGGPFMINRGDFQLFNKDERAPDTQNLTYNFDMVSTAGEVIHFNGYKVVNTSVAFDPLQFWKSTSTLYVTLTRPDKSVIGRGILNIRPLDFLAEMTTVRSSGPTVLSKLRATAYFFSYFMLKSADVFFTPLGRLQWPSPSNTGYITETAMNATYTVKAIDGVQSTLQMWDPRGTATEDAPCLLLIPGAALDHTFYALPTIEVNAVDYFRDAGYRVFHVTPRIGKTKVAQKNGTTYDARLDIAASLQFIREEQGKDKVYCIAHCMGSVSLAAGLLDGSIPADWVAGITASNVFMHPKWAHLNMIKAKAPIPLDGIYKAVAGNWFSCTSSTSDSLVQRVINQVLRFYPVGARDELCSSVACHRASFAFGRLFNHKQLNDATHRQFDRFIGGANMTFLNHAMAMGSRGAVMTNFPSAIDMVTPANVRRLKGIPVFFFSGADNTCLDPENTDTSYSLLRDTFGPDGYERIVFEGYNHADSWMGTEAHKDIWPVIKERVDKVMMAPGEKNGFKNGAFSAKKK
jgi:hypothetical protein